MKSFELISHYFICVLVVLSCVICGVFFGANRGDLRVAIAQASTDIIITNASEFVAFAQSCDAENDYFAGANIYLANDIDLGGQNFSDYRISSFAGNFSGVYQGKHHKIYNINMTAKGISGYYSLFSTLKNGGAIENLSIEANFDLSQATSADSVVYVSALCGKLSGTINNCYIKFDILGGGENSFSVYGVASNLKSKGKISNVYLELSADTQFQGMYFNQSSPIATTKLVCAGAVRYEPTVLDEKYWIPSETDTSQYLLKIMLPNADTSTSDGEGDSSSSETDGESSSGDESASGGQSGSTDNESSSGSSDTGGIIDPSESKPEATKTSITPRLDKNSYEFSGKAPNLEIIFDGTTDTVQYDLEISPSASWNVGQYTATIQLRDTEKYELSKNTVNFAIIPYKFAVIWDETPLTYNTQEQAPKFSFTPIPFATDLAINYRAKFTNAGNYTAELLVNSNFEITNSMQTFTISQYPVEISWANNELTYNGKQQIPEPSFERNEITQSLELSLLGYQKEANTEFYTAAVQSQNSNFVIKNGIYHFKINPARVTVVWDKQDTFEYNAQSQFRKYSLSLPACADEKDFYAKCDGEAIEIGTYKMQICTESKNFKILDNFANFTIKKYQLNVEWDKNNIFEYDGQPHFPAFRVTNMPDFCPNLAIERVNIMTSVGHYVAHLAVASDVIWVNNPACAYQITPCKLHLTWSNTTLFYNGSVQFPTAQTDPDLFTKVEIEVSGGAVNQSTYTATATILGEDAENFVIQNPQTEYLLLPFEFVAKWDTSEIVYDGKPHAPQILNDLPAFASDITLQYSDTKIDVGENYSTSVSFANDLNNNFVIRNPQCSFSIIPAVVNVEWGECNFVYNGQVQFPKFAFDQSFVNQYKINNQHKNAGKYSAEIVSLSDNYYFKNDTVDYVIDPYPVCINWQDKLLKYNTYLQKPTVMYTKTEFCNDLEIAVAGAEKFVGEYTAVASLCNNDLGNFELINPSTQYQILPKEIKINWQKIEVIYDGTSLSPTFECGEKCDDLEITCSSFVDAGVYQAVAETENPNYYLTNTTTQFTILPKPISVEWGSAEFVYNAEFLYPTATSPYTKLQIDGAQKYCGEYVATCVSASPNYVVQNDTQNFVIRKFEIDVVWAEENFVYSGKLQIPHADYTIPSFADSQDFVISGARINAGTGYSAEITCTNNNIIMKNGKKSFGIMPYEISLDWQEPTFVYNGSEQSPVYSFERNDLTENLTLLASGVGKDAGKHRILITTENSNFKIVNPSFEYSIEPYKVAVVWQEGVFVYNNQLQKPNFAFFAPLFAKDLQIVQPTGAKDAGTHTAKVSLDTAWSGAKNFVLTNASCDFEIKPYPLELAWTQIDAFYSGDPHVPTAKIKTAIDFDVLPQITVTGEAINEGNYTALAQIDNANFVLQNAECDFSILPQAIECECAQATVQISATNEEVVGKIDIMELTTEEFRAPTGQKFLFGFEIVEIVQVPIPMATAFATLRQTATHNNGDTAYFVQLYLAQDFEIPENASLYLLSKDDYYKLDYELDGDTLSFVTYDLGKIYLATPDAFSLFLPLAICSSVIAFFLLGVLVLLLYTHFKSKSKLKTIPQNNNVKSIKTKNKEKNEENKE